MNLKHPPQFSKHPPHIHHSQISLLQCFFSFFYLFKRKNIQYTKSVVDVVDVVDVFQVQQKKKIDHNPRYQKIKFSKRSFFYPPHPTSTTSTTKVNQKTQINIYKVI